MMNILKEILGIIGMGSLIQSKAKKVPHKE
jgi:hypothetical protein